MTAPARRYATLDGLRGIAVMGILLMNIAAFAMPEPAYSNPLAYGSRGVADLAAWAIGFVLVDGKMRGIFSLLFGASMVLVIDGADAAGRSGARTHLSRMGWLLLIGAAHFTLIWWGDILTLYAVMGSIAFLFVRKPVTVLIGAGAVMLLFQIMLDVSTVSAFAGLRDAASAPGASAQALRAWQEVVEAFGIPDRAWIAAQLALYHGGWATIAAHRIGEQSDIPVQQFFAAGPETLGFMLLGVAGLRSGFLTGEWDRARYRRWMVLGYGIGLPLTLALAAGLAWRGFDPLGVLAGTVLGGAIARLPMIAGHLALALLWLRGNDGRLVHRVIAAGRVALSNYLGTSLVMTGLFYGYGLGLFGRLGRAELWIVAAAACVAMLLWSKPWLERFAFGPIEWIWRSLARGKIQPWLKHVIASHYQ